MEHTVLIVAEKTLFTQLLHSMLEDMGFHVIATVETVTETMRYVKRRMPHFILLDIVLKNGESGIEAVKKLRRFCNPHVIYMGDDTDEETIKAAIETNPIYYLHKPFNRITLFATLSLASYKLDNDALATHHTVVLPDNHYFDLSNNLLYHRGRIIRLGRLEQSLLRLLVDAQGMTVPYQTIEDHLYHDKPVSQSTLRTLCSRLNSKIGHKIIETVTGIGYRVSRPT